MTKPCVFCKIIRGEAPSHVVLDEPGLIGVLDHAPLLSGHVLVMPRAHHPTLHDLPAHEVGTLFAAVQRVAKALEPALGADGSFIAINTHVSQSVPHLHVHVVPRWQKDGLFRRGMVWIRKPYASEDEAARVAATIRGALL